MNPPPKKGKRAPGDLGKGQSSKDAVAFVPENRVLAIGRPAVLIVAHAPEMVPLDVWFPKLDLDLGHGNQHKGTSQN